MPRLRLSFVSAFNERVQPLMDGSIQAEGVELMPTYSDPSETFWRQLNFQEFEISEMSLSSYLIAKSRGMDFVAIPVFPSRRFMHAELSYHVDSGIRKPGDVTGKRIGVGEYQQTASLWVRGILEHDFGVSQYKVDWYMERSEELSHGGATGFTPPTGIKFHKIPTDKSIASMMVNHEIDVASVNRAFSRESNIIDRSTHIRARGGDWSKVKPLFPDLMLKRHGFSKNMAMSRRIMPTPSAAMSTENIPGWRSICTRRLSARSKSTKIASAKACRRDCFSATNISPKPKRFSATILSPTASRRTGRCSKPSSTTPMSRA